MADMRIETEFIRRSLVNMGADVTKDQIIAIHKLLQFRSGNLLRSKVDAYDVSLTGRFGARLTFNHPVYERFLDMKRLKSRSGKVRRGSGFPIHNRIIWGNLGSLVFNIMNGMTREVVKEIKEDLNLTI